MDINVEYIDRTSVLVLSGRLDAHTAPQVRNTLGTLLDQGHTRVLVDMAQVDFVDSTGLSVLVSGMKHCRQGGGDLILAQLGRSVRLIFELTRLDEAITIYPDEATALASVLNS